MAKNIKFQYNEKSTTKSISTVEGSKIDIEEKERLLIFEADSVVARSSFAETINMIRLLIKIVKKFLM